MITWENKIHNCLVHLLEHYIVNADILLVVYICLEYCNNNFIADMKTKHNKNK